MWVAQQLPVTPVHLMSQPCGSLQSHCPQPASASSVTVCSHVSSTEAFQGKTPVITDLLLITTALNIVKEPAVGHKIAHGRLQQASAQPSSPIQAKHKNRTCITAGA